MNLDLITQSKLLLSQVIKPRTYYYEKLQMYLETHQIVVIQGQRRVGKSSIALGYLQYNNIAYERIFFLNKEFDVGDTVSQAKDLDIVYKLYIEQFGEPEYIVIDEVQDIQDREKFIRAVYAMKKYKIIITGSNSQLLSGELATYLAGRYLAFEVFPLGYDEFLTFTGNENHSDSFALYAHFGGMPEVLNIQHVTSKRQYLEGIMNTIFIKDIVKRYNIKDVAYLEKVLAYISDRL